MTNPNLTSSDINEGYISATEVRVRQLLCGYVLSGKLPEGTYKCVLNLIKEQHKLLLEINNKVREVEEKAWKYDELCK